MSPFFGRRDFLRSATGTLLSAQTVLLAKSSFGQASTPVAPSDRLRFGIIGVGMQGSGLLASALTLQGIECVGAADLYDGRHTLAKQLTANPNLFTTRHHQELLNRKDVDCVIAAVPDHWHMRVVTDACAAGKDVYCEKPMSHTISQGFRMVNAAKTHNRIVQIGSQRVSSALCAKARELVQNGVIGDIEMVELSLGRNTPNGAWIYPPPPDLTPENLDWNTWLNDAPETPFNPVRFARWRCWKEYGTGVAGDLMVHLISGMLYTLGWNEAPQSASALGGIFRWKDGRNMPDLHTVLFDYHGIPVYVRLSLAGETPELARFIGPKGILEATGKQLTYIPQSEEDTSPSYYAHSFPHELEAEYVAEWKAKHQPAPGKEPIGENTVFKGDDWDDVRPHLWNFFEAVRARKPVAEDAVFGNHAAIACHMANESYFERKVVTFDKNQHEV